MPEWKPEILRRLAPLKLSPAREAEIAEEIAQHIEDRYEELLATGRSEEAAFRIAVDELRDEDLLARGLRPVESDFYREPVALGKGSSDFFSDIIQDTRFAFRTLRKSPGFTAVAVLTLALGIGANTAAFSLIDAVMLRMLPVNRPDERLQLERQDPRYADVGSPSFSNPLWEQVRDQQNVFSGVFAWSNNQFDLARGGTVQPAEGSFVSGDFFTTLELRPAAGRLIAGSDDHRGCPPVAVLSYLVLARSLRRRKRRRWQYPVALRPSL